MNINKLLLLVTLTLFLSGCASASYHREALRDDRGDRITLGTVQREIVVGMSSAEVAEKLYQRAKGYEHPETKAFCKDGKIVTYEATKH